MQINIIITPISNNYYNISITYTADVLYLRTYERSKLIIEKDSSKHTLYKFELPSHVLDYYCSNRQRQIHLSQSSLKKKVIHSICACHPCAGAMLIFSV